MSTVGCEVDVNGVVGGNSDSMPFVSRIVSGLSAFFRSKTPPPKWLVLCMPILVNVKNKKTFCAKN